MWKKSGRRLRRALALSVGAMMLTPGLSSVAALPDTLVMRSGGALEVPVSALVQPELSEGGTVRATRGDRDTLRLTASDAGVATLSYKLMGFWPVKTVSVSVEPERRLIPGGQSVGIAIDTAGVIVVGASDLGATPSPARAAGLRGGDIIQRVNGAEVLNAEALSDAVSGGDPLTLEVLRDGKAVRCQVSPALDARDGRWRLGAWVRDSTAGVGTLTFVDPDTGLYGALGHAITDVDTSVTLPVGVGELYGNTVVDVTPSRHGHPGELTGDFVFHANAVGTVEHNSPRGIFGFSEKPLEQSLYPEGVPVGKRSDTHPGPATLLTTVDEGGPVEYACEVVRLLDANADGKSMVIRITDPRLLERTGGIVQGMSGSPILQEGRLVGAVTHVMVNDPAMGYAISIDAMLEEAERLEGTKKAAKAA